MGNETDRVLFVHAHPDDETIATGGTIATLVDQGVGVTVLTCTRGESGEVIPAELRHLEGHGAELAEYREKELAKAMHILGVTDHRYLGDRAARQLELEPRRYLDSGMVWGKRGAEPMPNPIAHSLCAAPFGEVAADIATVIASLRPDVVVSYDEQGGYGHPDHIRAHEAARRAAEVMGVPFFAIEPPGAPASRGAKRLDVSAVLDRKAEAMRAHRSQVIVDGTSYALSSGSAMPIAAVESYRRIDGDGDGYGEGARQEPSFSEQGIVARVFACLIAVIVGVAVGILGTVNHQSTLTLLDADIPLGVISALVTAAALFIGLRLVFAHRAPTAFAALGTLAVLWLFAQEGPGGSVLIPANTVGYLWSFGVPLLAAMVLAWPRLPARATS